MNEKISKDDYEEPRCPLNMHPEVTSVPIGRIMDKLDSYLDKNDFDAAKRHLKYWIADVDGQTETVPELIPVSCL